MMITSSNQANHNCKLVPGSSINSILHNLEYNLEYTIKDCVTVIVKLSFGVIVATTIIAAIVACFSYA